LLFFFFHKITLVPLLKRGFVGSLKPSGEPAVLILCAGFEPFFVFRSLAFDDVIFVEVEVKNFSYFKEIFCHKVAGNYVRARKISRRIGDRINQSLEMPAESLVKRSRKNNSDICAEIRRLLSLEPVKAACVVGVEKVGCLGYKLVCVLAVTFLFPYSSQ